MNRKGILSALLSLCMLCAPICADGAEKENQASGDLLIKVIYPTSRAMGDKNIIEFEDWFEDTFPDAKLEMVSAAITTLSDTVRSEIKNDNTPDVFVTTEYDAFLDSGYLEDITGMQALTKFSKSSVRNLERDGRVYALPLGGGVLLGLHYNKTLFDEYGLEYPDTSETLYEVIMRVNRAITENGLTKRPISAALLYPSQAAAVMNGIMCRETQTTAYLKWISEYRADEETFENAVFQDYLDKLDFMMNKKKDEAGEKIPDSGLLFGRDDYFSTQASSITSFLNGASFMYYGDVNRCYQTYGTEGSYTQDDIRVMGVPIGMEGITYVSYMDELYMGVSSEFDSFSTRKQEIIAEMLDYIASSDNTNKNIFTFTGPYCSTYLEGEVVQEEQKLYFAELNKALDGNFVAQDVNNTPFSSVFGKIILYWKKEQLGDIVETGNDIEKVTTILETYRKTGESLFAKSEEPIGTSRYFMEFQSNIMRTQETDLGDQVADLARDYMGTDFALINAGAIRASVPLGDISVQTINSILPYENNLVKIKLSGATLKKALAHAYDVGPTYKSGQFGDISGLRVKLRTNEDGYAKYEEKLNEWIAENPNAEKTQKNAQMKQIVEDLCSEDSECLNLELVEVTDSEGNEIVDDQIYSLAILDYLLQDKDGYDMLGVISENPDADRTIEVYDREDQLIEGTPDVMLEEIGRRCELISEAFADWVKAGNELTSQKDGRIEIEHFIYVE